MIKRKQWHVGSREDIGGTVAATAAALGISYPTALLLRRRGCDTPEAAAAFLRLETETLHDPFLFRDMERACDRLIAALDNREKIAVYGDYDVDGVTSVSLLTLYFREKKADVSFYIPTRDGEGYGVNREAIRRLADQGVSLIVTVDTGVTAVEEIAYACSLGCDVIVTDHHECRDVLPDAVAVINPMRPDCRYPFRELAGVGVAFKLITALEDRLRRRSGEPRESLLNDLCRRYIDLVALGTVADVMPLRDENRLIVSMGLRRIETDPRPGVRALLAAADNGKAKTRRPITASVIGFTLAPRINAAGRMDSAERAVSLFLTNDPDRAAAVAEELCEMNRRRQTEENRIVSEIRDRIAADPAIGSAPVIVLEDESWNHGVIGIVASRVTEQYGRPSILIAFDGDVGKGSGRSVKGLNLVEALTACRDRLVRYGGHELAAGLSIRREELPAFREELNAYVSAHLGNAEPTVTLDIDCALLPEEITLSQAEELSLLEPCGTANPVPLFFLGDLTVKELTPIGGNHHSRLLLEREGCRFPAVFFGASPEDLCLAVGDRCEIAFQLTVNEFMGSRSAQLVVRDIRLTEEQESDMRYALDRYSAVRSGTEPPTKAELPTREDFAAVYLRLKRAFPDRKGSVCLHTLLRAMNETPGPAGPISYQKLRLTLDVLADAGVLRIDETDPASPGREVFSVALPNLDQKVNLETSCLYKQLTTETITPISKNCS